MSTAHFAQNEPPAPERHIIIKKKKCSARTNSTSNLGAQMARLSQYTVCLRPDSSLMDSALIKPEGKKAPKLLSHAKGTKLEASTRVLKIARRVWKGCGYHNTNKLNVCNKTSWSYWYTDNNTAWTLHPCVNFLFSSLSLSMKGSYITPVSFFLIYLHSKQRPHLALCFQPPAERFSFGFLLGVAATFIASQRAHFQSYFLKSAAS